MRSISWLPPPETWQLAANEIHVWRASLALSAGSAQQLLPLLAPDEQARAGRFYFEEHRQRFIAGRAILRLLLGRYLQADPGLIRFAYNNYGKPALAEPFPPSLQFNVSHSGDIALYAITKLGPVGVDVEQWRSIDDMSQLVERFFSPHEQAEWLRLPASQRVAGFFKGWSCKEAYIKARGQGLSLPLEQFDVSLTPGQPAKLLADRHHQEITHWSLAHLDPGPGYSGAVAVEASAYQLKCWHYALT